jgi:arginine/serine-rich splicing factor 16
MWHEARRSEKKVHELMDAARRRAQRRAAYLARRRGDPHQSLQVSGARCRVHRDDALYQATEDQQGLCVPPLSHFVLQILFSDTVPPTDSSDKCD